MDSFEDRYEEFYGELGRILPTDRYSDSIVDRIIYSRDYWPLKVFGEAMDGEIEVPRLVLYPESTEDVAYIIKLANRYRIPIIPYGGGSGVVGAAYPSKNSVVMDLSGLNYIGEVDDENLIIEVGPGVLIFDLERYLNSKGYTLRHIPQSFPEAEVGGLIATRSTGEFSSKYGGIEDLLMSLEVVLPNGIVIRTKKVPRRSVGPRIEEIFIGSEGIYGVITRAVLKIRPIPNIDIRKAYVFDNFLAGIKAIREMARYDIFPPVVRLYDREEVHLRFAEYPDITGKSLLLLIFEGYDDRVVLEADYAEKILNKYGKEYTSDPVDKWLDKRFDVISEISRILSIGAVYDTIEVSGLWSDLPSIYNSVKDKASSIKGVITVMTHLSHIYRHGGCLYFTVGGIPPENITLSEFYHSVWKTIMETVLEYGGSISHHHGIGLMRRRWISREHGDGVYLLRALKESLDPRKILNPYKLIGDDDEI
jgi:alkyldihydroxyacetonephosphate synthase